MLSAWLCAAWAIKLNRNAARTLPTVLNALDTSEHIGLNSLEISRLNERKLWGKQNKTKQKQQPKKKKEREKPFLGI